mgnify:CR=1 FL=1|jgi:hypothetical protein
MKNILWAGLAFVLLVALFGDGGATISPSLRSEINPDVNASFAPNISPSLRFEPKLSYQSPTTIYTNVESQINVGQVNLTINIPAAGQPAGYSSTTIDPAYRLCQPLPGETITQGPDTKGACFVKDAAGNAFFLNAAGSRWPLASGADQLQPQGELTKEQLQAAFLRNGGELPMLWDFRTEQGQIDWLKDQAATWQ